MAIHMPDHAELAVHPVTCFRQHAMVGGMAALYPRHDFGGGQLAIVNRDARPGDAAHQTEARPRSVGGRERRRPNAVDMHGVEIVRRPVGVEIAPRKYRADQGRSQFWRGRVKLVDIGVLGRTQEVERAAKAKIGGIFGPAVRRVEDQRHFIRSWVAAPQHPGNLEAHANKLRWLR